MQNYSVLTAETTKATVIKKIFGKVFFNAFADEPEASGGDEGDSKSVPQINFEAMIAQARKEEKDKLYPRIKKAEDEVKTLTSSLNRALLENAALKEAQEQAGSVNPEDTEEFKSMKSRVEALEAENQTLKNSAPDLEAIRSEIRAEYELKAYAQSQIEASKGDILSMLIPDISGKSKEEIDQAIASAKEKTLSVKKDLGLVDEEGNPVKPKKSAPTKPAKAAPAEEPVGETFDADYIRSLDPRSPEYLEFRKKMGLN